MVIAAVAFAVLNFLTPEYHDDFVYKFMFENGTVNYDHPIRSIGDIFVSQVEHYQSANGRSIVHFFVQLFTGLLGKPVFNIVNAIIFCLFLLLLRRYSCRNASGQGQELFLLSLTLILVLLMPRFKDTFLWMTGSVNYLWSATATLLFLLIYEKRRDRAFDWSLMPLLLIAFLLGWTHEGLTLPLAASLVIIHLCSIRKRGGLNQGLWLALAFLIGGCMIAFAPGTIARSGISNGLSALGLKAFAGLTVLSRLRLIFLALLAIVVGWLFDRKAVKRVVSRHGYLLLAALLSLGIIFTSGLESTRTAFGLELFSMLFVLNLIGEVMKGWSVNILKWSGICLAMGIVAFYALVLRHTIPSWQESRYLIDQIEHTNDGIIATNEHHAGLFSSFICTMLSPDSTVNAMNYDPHGWPASIAATYHRDSLIFLPQAFLDDLKARSERYEYLNLNTPFEFYVQRINDNTTIDKVVFHLAPNDFSDISPLLRPIARRMNRYTDTTVPTAKWTIVTLYGRRYLIIKKDHTLHHRLLNISTG